MLVQLAIRDIVLIDRLELEFREGLGVLTGETGAGKSILLDAFALALGARGDGGLVRHGEAQGQVTAVFDPPLDHPARRLAGEAHIDTDGDLILRRVQVADGRTRAFINDQPVSAQVLKAVGAALVEIHGQHADRALVDPVDAPRDPRCVRRVASRGARGGRGRPPGSRRTHVLSRASRPYRDGAQGGRFPAPRRRGTDGAGPGARRRGGARRPAARDDAVREGGAGPPRRL